MPLRSRWIVESAVDTIVESRAAKRTQSASLEAAKETRDKNAKRRVERSRVSSYPDRRLDRWDVPE